ncbi:MAG: GNAT family N-acetyltransferase [Bacteroidota bacterium]
MYNNYSDNAKRNIKKAVKNNIQVEKNISPLSVINLFRENTGRKLKNLKDRNYHILNQLIQECISRGHAEVWGVLTKEKKLCAGIFWIKTNDRCIFHFSATNHEAKKNGSMFLLIDTFIREHAEKKIILDFEGSNKKNLAQFYKSFGAMECVYLQARKNNLPLIVKWLKEL